MSKITYSLVSLLYPRQIHFFKLRSNLDLFFFHGTIKLNYSNPFKSCNSKSLLWSKR